MEVPMIGSPVPRSLRHCSVSGLIPLAIFGCLTTAGFLGVLGCSKDPSPNTPAGDNSVQSQFAPAGEEVLVDALDEIESIAGFAQQTGNAALPSKSNKSMISSAVTDSAYIYGEITPDGYGAVVTERHTYPKGLLLITVRKSYGKPLGKIVSVVKRYTSYHDFAADSSQQSTVTELFGLSADTLVTYVNRNGLVQTYTFRLPVVTRVTNPVDGSVRVTSRFALGGAVRSEIRDGGGRLVQFRDTFGDSTGALTTYTQFADSSWRRVRTLGLSDGSVHHEITSGP
jgi:hypothetical protein